MDTENPHSDEACDLEWLLDRLLEKSRPLVARYRLPGDLCRDLAHDAFARLWAGRGRAGWPPGESAIEAALAASARRHATLRKGETLAATGSPSEDSDGVPELCPNLRVFAPFHKSPPLFRATLDLAAAVIARYSKCLTPDQFRHFDLAYIARIDIDSIAGRVGAPNTRSTQRRLRRVRDRIEQELVRRLAKHMPAASADELARVFLLRGRRLRPSNSASSAALAAHIAEALGRVVKEGPGLA